LITDYSSVFFDYANLKRPILFYTYDIEMYQGQLRGFYIDMETELPGPLLMNNDEVVDAIENIDAVSGKYSERYEEFYERFCSWDDGRSSEKVVDAVFEEQYLKEKKAGSNPPSSLISREIYPCKMLLSCLSWHMYNDLDSMIMNLG